MKKVKQTPLRAIRSKCVDCGAGSLVEVRLCPVTTCAIWPYRMGKRPTTISQISKKSLVIQKRKQENQEDLEHSTLRNK
jgi:hypothetical protein